MIFCLISAVLGLIMMVLVREQNDSVSLAIYIGGFAIMLMALGVATKIMFL